MRALALVAVCALTSGCGTLASFFAPDPRLAENRSHVQRLVAKDPDPEDAPLNQEALGIAAALEAEAVGKAAIGPAAMGMIRSAAPGGGIPWDTILGIVGTAGAAFTTMKTVRRAKAKKAKGAPAA